MRRILLFGRDGQVGWELRRALAPLGNVIALEQEELDLANPDSIRQAIGEIKPSLIVNAAGYTAVDRAEAEPHLAMQINGVAAGVLAEEAKRHNVLLVHYSTDYVFDGTKKEPYTEDDPPNPLSEYGRSKRAGDKLIISSGAAYLIFRTSWVYAARGHNFVLTMLRLGQERSELRIVDDQIGAPTWARFIGEATARIIGTCGDTQWSSTDRSGIYNLTPSGAVSWYGFAKVVFAEAEARLGLKCPKLIPIATADYPLPARRPANSCLDTSKLTRTFGVMPPGWEEMLRTCMREISDNFTSAG